MSTGFDWYPYPFDEDRSFPCQVGYHHLLTLSERTEYHIEKRKKKIPWRFSSMAKLVTYVD